MTDNPLLFVEQGDVLSGGNFHAEPVAFAADTLALAIAEIGSLSERRIAVLVDPKMSGLPAFLVENSGLNSGFMIAQVTAAALVSENKAIAAPCSVDSIPTSANQEDHVSMATHAARRLGAMVENAAAVDRHRAAGGGPGHRFSPPGPLLRGSGAGAREHSRRGRATMPSTATSPRTSRRPNVGSRRGALRPWSNIYCLRELEP